MSAGLVPSEGCEGRIQSRALSLACRRLSSPCVSSHCLPSILLVSKFPPYDIGHIGLGPPNDLSLPSLPQKRLFPNRVPFCGTRWGIFTGGHNLTHYWLQYPWVQIQVGSPWTDYLNCSVFLCHHLKKGDDIATIALQGDGEDAVTHCVGECWVSVGFYYDQCWSGRLLGTIPSGSP